MAGFLQYILPNASQECNLRRKNITHHESKISKFTIKGDQKLQTYKINKFNKQREILFFIISYIEQITFSLMSLHHPSTLTYFCSRLIDENIAPLGIKGRP